MFWFSQIIGYHRNVVTSEQVSEDFQTWRRKQGNIARECFVDGDFVFWSMQTKLVSCRPKKGALS